MEFGQVSPVLRMSSLSARRRVGPVHVLRSRWLAVRASQSWPTMCRPSRGERPVELEAIHAAIRWMCNGRGAALRRPRRARLDRERGCEAAASLVESDPSSTDPVTLRERGRSQMAVLSTGWRRDVRCQTEGRRACVGVLQEPVPRRTSTAKPVRANTARTVVTVRGLHAATAAMRALVTAQWRPEVPSANRARAALTRVKVVARRCAQPSISAPATLSAHLLTWVSQPEREVHIGIVAGTEPAATIHARRRRRKQACSRRMATGAESPSAKSAR
jgi:hypothetical protein